MLICFICNGLFYKIAELEQIAQESEAFHKRIEEIKKVLANAQRDANKDAISKEFVEKYIDKIFVTPSDENTLLLQVKIFTGEMTEKYLRKLELRSGIITTNVSDKGKNSDTARVSDDESSVGHTIKTKATPYRCGLIEIIPIKK